MRQTPPVEGEFVCKHAANNMVDLISILTNHKKYYKTVLTALGKNKHSTTLFHFLSCEKCYERIRVIRQPSNGDKKYRIKGTIMNHSRGCVDYNHIITGYENYRSIRKELNTPLGSGYRFDRKEALEIWKKARFLAFRDYVSTGKSWKEWKQSQKSANTADKSRITRLTKAKVSRIVKEMNRKRPVVNYAFDDIFSESSQKSCVLCRVIFRRRDVYCRFCRALNPAEIRIYAERELRVKRRLSELRDKDKREAMSNKVEIESEQAMIADLIERVGRDETKSYLIEVYGSTEAYRMMEEYESKQAVITDRVEEEGRNATVSDLVERGMGRTEAREMVGISESESEDEEGLSEGERNEK